MTSLTSTSRGLLRLVLSGLVLGLPLQAGAAALCIANITSAGHFFAGSNDSAVGTCAKSNSYQTGGRAEADASVSPGQLRAMAGASTNSSQPDDGTVLGAVATARLTDQLVVTGLQEGQRVRLTFAIGVNGRMDSSLVLDAPLFFGYSQTTTAVAEFSFVASLRNGDQGTSARTEGCVFALNPSVSVCNGFAPQSGALIDTVLLLSLDVELGDQLDLSLELTARAGARAQAEATTGSAAEAGADFGHTVEWLGLRSATVGGETYSGPLGLRGGDTGFDYLRGVDTATVPEPATALLVLPLLVGLGAGMGRPARRRSAS